MRRFRVSYMFGIICVVLLQIACAAKHDGDQGQSSFASTNKDLESAALKVIQTHCASCHGPEIVSGGVGDLTSPAYLLAQGLIVPFDATKGRLMGAIMDGSMPPMGNLTNIEIESISAWINLGFSLDTSNGGTITDNPINTTSPNVSGSPLQISALTIIQNKCSACHGSANGSGGVSNIMSVQHLLESQLIVSGNPNMGRFMGSIYEGRMPVSNPLSNNEITTLENWIKTDINPNTQNDLAPPEEVMPTYSSIAKLILVPKCVACHGTKVAKDGIRVDNYDVLFGAMGSKNIINVGNASESKLYDSVKGGAMPPRSDGYAQLTNKELMAIADWINKGALP